MHLHDPAISITENLLSYFFFPLFEKKWLCPQSLNIVHHPPTAQLAWNLLFLSNILGLGTPPHSQKLLKTPKSFYSCGLYLNVKILTNLKTIYPWCYHKYNFWMKNIIQNFNEDFFFYIFTNLFNSWLKRSCWILIFASAFIQLDILFWLMFKKIWSPTKWLGKEGSCRPPWRDSGTPKGLLTML